MNFNFNEVYIWGIWGQGDLALHGWIVDLMLEGTSLITLNDYHFIAIRN